MNVAMQPDSIMERFEMLGQISEEPNYLVRRSYTDALRDTHTHVAAWMGAAGMTVREDQAGNLIGRYASPKDDAQTLILGSHLDTVRDAGKYDGPLGILIALACVERLQRDSVSLPFAVEVICFADEEGLRFGNSYLGSQAVAGTFEQDVLERTDADGISLRDAMLRFGADPDAIPDCARRRESILGYCEVHIEQGPVLEAADLPVGVVQAIIGQSRFTVQFVGEAGHAGTVPMAMRHDALCAAAEFVLAVEEAGRHVDALVATTGQLTVEPGASNVIPGNVTLSLDIRHGDDVQRAGACRDLQTRAEQIAQRRGVQVDWRVVQESTAVPCAPALFHTLEQAVAACGYRVLGMSSGAGHDAVAMATLTPIAMLFVRCRGGISHNPAEAVEEADVVAAVEVMMKFLGLLAQEVV